MIEYQWRTVLAYLPDYLHAAVLALRITVLGFVLALRAGGRRRAGP